MLLVWLVLTTSFMKRWMKSGRSAIFVRATRRAARDRRHGAIRNFHAMKIRKSAATPTAGQPAYFSHGTLSESRKAVTISVKAARATLATLVQSPDAWGFFGCGVPALSRLIGDDDSSENRE